MAIRSLGRLFVVATPIGNLSDMTPRALEVLRSVRVVACEDTRRGRQLLTRFGVAPDSVLALHDHNEVAASRRVLERLLAGDSVALISDAGTPLVSDPGFELVRRAWQAGVGVTPVPGASALTAALAASPIPAGRFRFEGFLPAKAEARHKRLQVLLRSDVAVVFFEAPHRLRATLREMVALGTGSRPLLVCRELTKRYETVRLAAVAEHLADLNAPRGEFCCVLDAAAAPPSGLEADDVLRALADELPPAQAARLAARITGKPRAALFQRLLSLRGHSDVR